MKILNRLTLLFIAVIMVMACKDDFIDPLTPTDPGPDESAPLVTINFPQEGTVLQTNEQVTSINIKFEVSDDIEIKDVSIQLDGAELIKYSEFLDYRRFLNEYLYDQVTNGLHVLTISATDMEGKTGTATVNFEKGPPYLPVYEGEVFYMSFDGDYLEKNSLQEATAVGSPGFAGAGNGIQGGDAYKGGADSYLTFPTAGLQGAEFSASFWLKVNAVPDRAGVLVMGPVDEANPTSMNNRKNGFRFFRENAGGKQRFKLNVGNGTADSWFDGGAAADVDPAAGEWAHMAFTISETESVVYINGEVVKQGAFSGVDWSGCDVLSIMSGAPRFTGWGHNSDESLMDELRLFTKALTQDEIKGIILSESAIFRMSFEDDYTDQVSGQDATVVGTPGFGGANSGFEGNAYSGATDAYLTFPTDGLQGSEFSASFFVKVNDVPDRAGVLVMGPVDEANPDAMNNRKNGFRFFRENAGGKQRFKLNVGNGTADSWFDGGAAADVDPTVDQWVHMAFTISSTESVVYIDGQVAKQGIFTGVDWTGCDVLSIMSGAPRFTGWDHKSDEGMMDELMLFDRALTLADVQILKAGI